ncbi:aminotransferase yhxA [Bacillus sp. DNRA2]|uniref:aminotransferase yhxA n=1 Tax=Bacillus sp. DNRA2 TaxID=2723053 RepID=UPI00145E77FE|nr:aminotransferase yhxA [Bacillus sp. DNRA2]NMD69477.1 aminotransferase yhxA [Bacillus sp. DNRA2]
MKKTKRIMAGISTTALAFGLSGCGNDDLPPVPDDTACNDWEWDSDDGVWECDEYESSYYGHYYYGGSYYSSKSSLYKNKGYSSYKKSSSFKGGGKASSGFGSGSKSFGG